jgi:Flp pilus assembly protein TadG
MRPPLIQRPGRSIPRRTRERGVTMALVALAMVGILAMAALSIDIGTLYEASAEAQRAADAGALAAARFISMQGLTGDPTNTDGTWQTTCANATLIAQNVAAQDTVGGSAPNTVTVTYSSSSGSSTSDCTSSGNVSFGVNPTVTVKVTQTKLPIFFARVFSLIPGVNYSNTNIGATATAEIFNSSNSNTYAGGSVVPVQPRCVKPWIVPNYDPTGGQCNSAFSSPPCKPFVVTATSVLGNPGMLVEGGGVIGERFWLLADCTASGTNPCTLLGGVQPQANLTGGAEPGSNVEYVPGEVPAFSSAFTAIPACASSLNPYAQAIAACDQSTQYQCGAQNENTVNLGENPVTTDTTSGVQCLTHQSGTSTFTLNGQDALLPTGTFTSGGAAPNYPFQIQVGTANPLINASPNPVSSGGVITSSNSIASLPIYDSSVPINPTGTSTITIVGFLQVFINVVDGGGNMYVTVLNVSGCGNNTSTPVNTSSPLYGTSPVPIRLITPTPPSS